MISVAMQYYYGDMDSAMDASRILAQTSGTDPDNRPYWIFFHRFDTPAPDKETIKIISEFFIVDVIKGRRKETGWPIGCNAVWQELMTNFLTNVRDSVYHNTDGILTLESDVIPLKTDWFTRLQVGWDMAKAKREWRTPHAMGAVIDPGLPEEHINGNGVFAHDITVRIPTLNGGNPHASWDTENARYILQDAEKTHLIVSEHGKKGMVMEEFTDLVKSKAAIFHGLKTEQGRNYAKAHLL